MVRWSQPVALVLLVELLNLLIFFSSSIVLAAMEGPRWIIYLVILAIVVGVVAHYIGKWRFGELYDHEMSRWNMEMDQVLGRLDAAMLSRGVRVAADRDGDRVTYPLPPLSIAVDRGWWGTRVFVGPSYEDNELVVWKLKAFVERAMT